MSTDVKKGGACFDISLGHLVRQMELVQSINRINGTSAMHKGH